MSRTLPVAQILAAYPQGTAPRVMFGSFGSGGPATPPVGPNSGVIAFCSDEDIARRAGADFPLLAGQSQVLARGLDGSFASPSLDPWTLTSASVNFQAQGLQPGDVLQLTFPRVVAGNVTYPGPSQLLAVESVDGTSVTTRRIGLGAGLGDPPCPPAGFAAAVHFVAPTLYPQILDASRDLRQLYGLDDLIWGRRTSDLYDLTQLIEPCVFKVLSLRYLDGARGAGEGSDDFRAKFNLYQDQFTSTADRLSVHFKPSPLPTQDLSRFSTRIVR